MKNTRRWTIEIAAAEFGINPRTLSSRIKTNGIIPGKDRQFSTAQICQAIYGNIDGEKLRKATADADIAEVDRDKAFRQILPVSVVNRAWESIIIPAKEKFQRMPSKLAGILIGLSQTEIEKTLQQEVDEISQELSSAPDYSYEEDSSQADSED